MNDSVEPRRKRVVLLVDSKIRDLDVAILIAHHLRERGIDCYLEPLEAYRAVLAAYKPDMVIINHLMASHLERWSKRLQDMGILTAILPNEGIYYDKEQADYYAGLHHNQSHADLFFCWNESHRDAIRKGGTYADDAVKVVGVPRFDYYFEPWSRVVYTPRKTERARPLILFCTNFGTAYFWTLPKENSDRLFAPWLGKVSIYSNYWQSIEAQWNSRNRVFDYFQALLDTGRFDILLRPHPMEDTEIYDSWIAGLSADHRVMISIDHTTNVTPLILDCDLQISCETCTTALESWLADKPSIELLFDQDPLWYAPEQGQANVSCSNPDDLAGMIDLLLVHAPEQKIVEARKTHLEKWCSSPNGTSSALIAEHIAEKLHHHSQPDWRKLNWTDQRRRLKLWVLRSLNLGYHYDVLLWLKNLLNPQKYVVKKWTYSKSIKPSDVREAEERFAKRVGSSDMGQP